VADCIGATIASTNDVDDPAVVAGSAASRFGMQILKMLMKQEAGRLSMSNSLALMKRRLSRSQGYCGGHRRADSESDAAFDYDT
jgi:hypothetical protein